MNCRSCGLCCFSDYEEEQYVDLDQKDWERLPVRYQRMAKKVEYSSGCLSLPTKNHVDGGGCCVAFSGRLLKKCKCLIYVVRPTACRQFKKGGTSCLRLRKGGGDCI